MSEYKFETLQLHVGQEQADSATDSRAVPITRQHLMCSIILPMLQQDLDLLMQGIFMEDLQTLHRMCWKRDLQP